MNQINISNGNPENSMYPFIKIHKKFVSYSTLFLAHLLTQLHG